MILLGTETVSGAVTSTLIGTAVTSQRRADQIGFSNHLTTG